MKPIKFLTKVLLIVFLIILILFHMPVFATKYFQIQKESTINLADHETLTVEFWAKQPDMKKNIIKVSNPQQHEKDKIWKGKQHPTYNPYNDENQFNIEFRDPPSDLLGGAFQTTKKSF
ncbi:hypothetical protein [Candidatus Phytoplasma fraxini]|uniref:Uncharacterized protein n=1 Tax=Ash yellows phytoplasma TaxID=35780 RepID=A0ABZ2U9Z9_ASHYP